MAWPLSAFGQRTVWELIEAGRIETVLSLSQVLPRGLRRLIAQVLPASLCRPSARPHLRDQSWDVPITSVVALTSETTHVELRAPPLR